MKVGDLVQINDLKEVDPKRIVGTIVSLDIYDSQSEKIAEVMWNDGHASWILLSRLELINGIDTKRKNTN